VVCRFEQVLHFVVGIDHIVFSAINVIPKLPDAHVLRLDFCAEILGLVLGRLDDANHSLELVVLVLNHILLDIQHLPVVQVPSLIKFVIFSSLVPLLFYLGGKRCLIVFYRPVLLGELSRD